MKQLSLLAALAVVLAFPAITQADDDDGFYGLIGSRPTDGNYGTWVIGGRQITVTERTKLKQDDGPLAVGTCVEVDYDDGIVEEIEAEKSGKCQ